MVEDKLAELCDVVFGGAVDPQELISKAEKPKKVRTEAERQRLQARVGFASNILGITAGGAALVAAGKNPALRKPLTSDAGPITGKLAGKLKNPKARGRLIRAGAGGAIGLQAANLGGDLVTNRVLGREAKKKPVAKSYKPITNYDEAVAKAFNPMKVVKPFMGGAKSGAKGVAGPQASRAGQAGMKLGAGLRSAGSKMGAMAPKAQSFGAAAKPKVQGMLNKPMFKPVKPIAAKAVGTLKKYPKASAGAGVGAVAAGSYGAGRRRQNSFAKSLHSDVNWTVPISKVDADKHQAFGWATVTHVNNEEVTDRQGDVIPLGILENSAYAYVEKSRQGGNMHRQITSEGLVVPDGQGERPHPVGHMIESMVFTPEKVSKMGLDPNAFPLYGWWVGMKINDNETWQQIKSGERTGLSIHGKGRRRPL